jgi:hypothetical protein
MIQKLREKVLSSKFISNDLVYDFFFFLKVRSVIGDNALIHKMNSKNENSGKANILSYNGLRTPKLYNPHTETLKNIYQKWENIVNYFSSTGSHY